MRGLLFVGTDTGVGKTFVVAAVARTLREQGRPFTVCKPVATGAARVDGRWLSEDTVLLAAAAGIPGRWDDVTAWAFPDPVAPPVAARRQGVTLTLGELVGAVRLRQRSAGPVLVEGVGGLLCPLTDQETVADLAAVLRLPVVIVARRGLGTLNHTLLTVSAAQGRGLSVAGVVVSATEPVADPAAETNVEELRRRLDVPLLAVVPHQRDAAAPFGLASVDWWQLCSGSPRPRFGGEGRGVRG
jgi:dethiobiotin synthetase